MDISIHHVGGHLYLDRDGAPAPVYYLWPHYAGSQYPQRLVRASYYSLNSLRLPLSGWCQQAHGVNIVVIFCVDITRAI